MNKNQLIQQAKAVLAANYNEIFTKPAPSLYPHQWNWDAGFIALGLAHYDWARAAQELRYLFTGQWKNGMLPHIVFGDDPADQYFPGADFWQTKGTENAPVDRMTSGITQPPVFGFVLLKMYQIAEDKTTALEFLREMYPKIHALHNYYYTYRDPNEEGLVYVRHPWEPGTDNSPTWDSVLEKMNTDELDIPNYTRKDLQNPKAAAHRPTQDDYDRYIYLVDLFRKNKYEEAAIDAACPFKVQDPLFNAILAWSNESMIEVCKLIKADETDFVIWNELTVFSMNEKLWDEEFGIYNAFDLVAEELIPCETNSGFIPLVADIPSLEQAEKILKNLESQYFSGTKENPMYVCPTYSVEAEDINFEKYWRGPVWINMNWMLYQGLLKFNMSSMADKIKNDSLELLSKYGFYEYFDPRKNLPMDAEAGYGTGQFSWSAALCIDFLLNENEKQNDYAD